MTQVVRVQYDGGEAEDGLMSAADLGGAIIGMGEMVSGASQIVMGDETHVRARVRTDFGGNSFLVVFEIVSFTADLLSSVDSVVSLLGLAENSNGLIQTLQWIRSRRITAIHRPQFDDPGASMTIRIGEDVRELSVSDVRALRDEKTMRGIVNVMKPLLEGNATRVTLGKGDGSTVPKSADLSIQQEEATHFKEPAFPEDDLATRTYEMILTVVVPVLTGDYMWRFEWSGNIFTAKMEDGDFVNKIRANQVDFGYGDTLRVRMETDEILRKDGTTTHRHRILKVLAHKRRERYGQIDLLPH